MPDDIVSVRMPEALYKELCDKANDQHYMDVSEAVRDLLRRKYAQYRQDNVSTQQLIQGLQTLILQLENGAKQEE